MIKKINVTLVLIAIIGSIYITITKDKSLLYVLKDMSIILTINALYIIKKIFKLNISDAIILIYILFIFNAHFLGVTINLYGKIYWFDKYTHFLSGIISSFGAIFILVKSKKNGNRRFDIFFIISVTLMVAALWEMFEFTSSCLFNVDPQRVKLTGVTDTMEDIIVAFLGSIIVSMMYYFEYKWNNNLLIKKFINNVN